MAMKISKGKGFYCWLIAVFILVTFFTSLTNAEVDEPIDVRFAEVDESMAVRYYQGTEYINFEDLQFPIFSPPEYNVAIILSPSAIDPTSKNSNSISDIEVTVTNDSGTPVHGVNLTLTSNGGEIANELGITGYYGTFNTEFTSYYSGTFSINVNGNNFAGSDSARITVLNTDPTAKFEFSPSNTNVASTVTFDASDSNDIDGTIDDYSWEFGDGTSGKGEEVSHTYQNSGEFTPSLTVTDNLGGKDTFSSSSKISVNPNELAMKVSMSSNPVSVDTGKLSTITVTVKGADDKEIPEAAVKLTTNIGDVNQKTGKTDEFGQFTS
ncbi:MAG: PKD domain-containing protein, partial [Alphaproteobacteria bacterium]